MVTAKETTKAREPLGLLAQFDGPDSLTYAAEQLRLRGYKNVEAFSPFPIHGLDHVLGVRPSRLPWLVLIAGILGGVLAIVFQWWSNAVDYPYLISGKPKFSLPANIPVAFEVIILAAAVTAFFGMLRINDLPRLANPLLRNDRFRAATNDGFFLLVPPAAGEGEHQAAHRMLHELGGKHIEGLADIEEPTGLPKQVLMAAAILAALALIPPVVIASSRSTTSEKPRLHNFFDMDFQPKFKSQTVSDLFADGRAMRPRVRGTVGRGQLREDELFHLGIASADGPSATGPDKSSEQPQDAEIAEPNWATEFPLPVTSQLMDRGRERFNIHCAICHGKTGQGNGLASLRALELEQGTWVPPTSIHADHVKRQPVGQLFHSITNGVRKMPAYGHQISPEDRWAIVLYLRALQRSQDTSLEDVPPEIRPTLREMN